jgi:hypothetical protein
VAESPNPLELLRVLERHRVRYVLIGAAAGRVAGAPVVTEDIDVTPSSDPENLGRLAEALRELKARLRTPSDPDGVPFPIEPEFLANAESWTLTTSAGDLDLVFHPAGTQGYDDLARDASRVDVGSGLTITVAALRDVIRSKEAAGRAKDLGQLPLLRQTLELIRERERSGQDSQSFGLNTDVTDVADALDQLDADDAH